VNIPGRLSQRLSQNRAREARDRGEHCVHCRRVRRAGEAATDDALMQCAVEVGDVGHVEILG
jgi:hypothetical protein